jgi:hypothetical protein
MKSRGLIVAGIILAASITPTWSDALQIVRATPGSDQAAMRHYLLLWYLFVAFVIVLAYQITE